MKKIFLSLTLLSIFGIKLLAVPAVPFLITFAQPDGSTFKAHLKGDEHFSWIESKNKMIIVKNKTSGYFEFDGENVFMEIIPNPEDPSIRINSYPATGRNEITQRQWIGSSGKQVRFNKDIPYIKI